MTVFGVWSLALLWFRPRLLTLLDAARGEWAYAAVLFLVVFTEVGWLYGFYNLGVVAFAAWYRHRHAPRPAAAAVVAPSTATPVAVLYTTCNDFVERSALSFVALDYPAFTVYILDDSSDPEHHQTIGCFAARYPDRVKVVRRPNRPGFKAGNLNHAVEHGVRDPYFVIADADEQLPPDFPSVLVPRIEAAPQRGFIQANHASNAQRRTAIDGERDAAHPVRHRRGPPSHAGHRRPRAGAQDAAHAPRDRAHLRRACGASCARPIPTTGACGPSSSPARSPS